MQLDHSLDFLDQALTHAQYMAMTDDQHRHILAAEFMIDEPDELDAIVA